MTRGSPWWLPRQSPSAGADEDAGNKPWASCCRPGGTENGDDRLNALRHHRTVHVKIGRADLCSVEQTDRDFGAVVKQRHFIQILREPERNLCRDEQAASKEGFNRGNVRRNQSTGTYRPRAIKGFLNFAYIVCRRSTCRPALKNACIPSLPDDR